MTFLYLSSYGPQHKVRIAERKNPRALCEIYESLEGIEL